MKSSLLAVSVLLVFSGSVFAQNTTIPHAKAIVGVLSKPAPAVKPPPSSTLKELLPIDSSSLVRRPPSLPRVPPIYPSPVPKFPPNPNPGPFPPSPPHIPLPGNPDPMALFRFVDMDSNGSITSAEWLAAASRLRDYRRLRLGGVVGPGQSVPMLRLFSQIDTNSDELISVDEWLAAYDWFKNQV